MINFWKIWLEKEFTQDYFQPLKKFVDYAYQQQLCLPPQKQLFRAFQLTPKDQVRVVILGQDPYPGLNQANGLAFAVERTQPLPASLKNIFQELRNNYPEIILNHGDLSAWARQGVLLLNSVLTVAPNQSASHRNQGWEQFNQKVLKEINDTVEFVIFILWGKWARSQKTILDINKHIILESSHPSPLSAHLGFLGSKVFLHINQILKSRQLPLINWEIK